MSKAQCRKRLQEAKHKLLKVFAGSSTTVLTKKDVDDWVAASVAIDKLIRKFK